MSCRKIQVFCVCADATLLGKLDRWLPRDQFLVESCATGHVAARWIHASKVPTDLMVIMDWDDRRFGSGFDLQELLDHRTPSIVFGPSFTEDEIERMYMMGVWEVLSGPLDEARVLSAVTRAWALRQDPSKPRPQPICVDGVPRLFPKEGRPVRWLPPPRIGTLSEEAAVMLVALEGAVVKEGYITAWAEPWFAALPDAPDELAAIAGGEVTPELLAALAQGTPLETAVRTVMAILADRLHANDVALRSVAGYVSCLSHSEWIPGTLREELAIGRDVYYGPPDAWNERDQWNVWFHDYSYWDEDFRKWVLKHSDETMIKWRPLLDAKHEEVAVDIGHDLDVKRI